MSYLFLIKPIFYYLCWITCDYTIRWYIFCHNSVTSDDSTIAYRNTTIYDSFICYPNIVSYYRRRFYVLVFRCRSTIPEFIEWISRSKFYVVIAVYDKFTSTYRTIFTYFNGLW